MERSEEIDFVSTSNPNCLFNFSSGTIWYLWWKEGTHDYFHTEHTTEWSLQQVFQLPSAHRQA